MAELIGGHFSESNFLPISKYLLDGDISSIARDTNIQVRLSNGTFQIIGNPPTEDRKAFFRALETLITTREEQEDMIKFEEKEARADLPTVYYLVIPKSISDQERNAVFAALVLCAIPFNEYEYKLTASGNKEYKLSISPNQSEVLRFRIAQINKNLNGLLTDKKH